MSFDRCNLILSSLVNVPTMYTHKIKQTTKKWAVIEKSVYIPTIACIEGMREN